MKAFSLLLAKNECIHGLHLSSAAGRDYGVTFDDNHCGFISSWCVGDQQQVPERIEPSRANLALVARVYRFESHVPVGYNSRD